MQAVIPLVVIFMGPPGSGKGTQAGPLSQHLGVPHISTGDLLRQQIRGRGPLGLLAIEYLDRGNLVPDQVVLDIVFDRISQPDCKHGYILDGFPRTMHQAIILDKSLKPSTKVVVLNFKLPDSIIVERVTGRIGCKECGRPHHKYFDPPKKPMVCDDCGGCLCQREDDTEEVIRKRLQVYRNQTEPLIEYYATQKDVLHEIDSSKEKQAVFNDVLESISMNLSLR